MLKGPQRLGCRPTSTQESLVQIAKRTVPKRAIQVRVLAAPFELIGLTSRMADRAPDGQLEGWAGLDAIGWEEVDGTTSLRHPGAHGPSIGGVRGTQNTTFAETSGCERGRYAITWAPNRHCRSPETFAPPDVSLPLDHGLPGSKPYGSAVWCPQLNECPSLSPGGAAKRANRKGGGP